MSTLEFLGTGASRGVPVVACECYACQSKDCHDKRLRTSAIIRIENGPQILIDCGPDMRIQALRSNISTVDACLITHVHADHIFGIDDLRAMTQHHSITMYSSEFWLEDIRKRFSFIFNRAHASNDVPDLALKAIDGPFKIWNYEITPIPLLHGKLSILGFRIGNTAYLTDATQILPESYQLLVGVETLVINGLCVEKHVQHFSFSEALDEIAKIHPKDAYITHITHHQTHEQIIEYIENEKNNRHELAGINIQPAYDRLIIPISL